MKRFWVGFAVVAVACLGYAGSHGTCQRGADGGAVTRGVPQPGGVYAVDPGPWQTVPLVRDLKSFNTAADAAERDRREVLAELVRSGVISLVPRHTLVRVAGPATEEWMSIVSPVAGEHAGLAGCVPNSWLTVEPPASDEPPTATM